MQEGARVRERTRETEGDREFAIPYFYYAPPTDVVYQWSLRESAAQTTPEGVLDKADVERFRRLVDEWHKETEGLALASRICSHPAYLKIIGMGKPAIRLILNELAKEPDHWFLALRVLTDANPVRQEDAGRMRTMAEAWLSWGKEHGYFDN
jgi:hypothetical protein